MKTLITALAALSLTTAATATSTTERREPPKTPSLMTGSEIALHNKGLTADHPDYIKCRKETTIGSLVKKHRVCKTTEAWKASWVKGNENARDTVDRMQQSFQNSN